MVCIPAQSLLLLLLLLPSLSADLQKSAGISTADSVSIYSPAVYAPKASAIGSKNDTAAQLYSTKWRMAHVISLVPDPSSNTVTSFTPIHTTRKNSGHKQCHKAIQQQPRNCSYIRDKCSGYGDGMFNYVELYYCSYSGWHMTFLVILLVWLSLLFIWLGVSASEYFSPNISTLAKLLRLPESLAGVTLLAVGNGAPDMFSTFSAVRAGSGALAIGQLVGSASFIVGVVLSATTFVSPVYRVSSIPYLRELFFFTATIGMVAAIVLAEKLTQSMAACMVGLYTMYVITVVLTTYYEEKCQYTQLQIHTEDANNSICQQLPESTSITNSSAEARPWRTNIAGHSASMLLEPLWSRSTTSLSSGARRQQWQQRRITTSATHTNLAGKDMWALDTLQGSASVRALGEFLSQHRKSLLAAAECSEILDEAHCAIASVDSLGLSGNSNESTFLQNEQADRNPAYGSTNATVPTAMMTNHTQEPTCAHEDGMILPSPHAFPLPPSWNNYTMGNVGSRTDGRGACAIESVNSAQETSPENSTQWFESDTTPSKYLHIVSLGGPSQKQAQNSPTVPGTKRTSLSPLSTHASHVSPDESIQMSYDPHSPLDHHTNRSPIPHADDASNASASIILPSTPQSFHAALAITDGDGPPCIWPPPSSSISVDMAGQQCGRGAAIARACIPTLHYWHSGASIKLKAFIAFSAIPVFLLTLTVPVLVFASDDDDENNSTPNSIRHTSQECTDQDLLGCNDTGASSGTQRICTQQEQNFGDSHPISDSSSIARISHEQSPSTSLLVCATSIPEASDEQSQKKPYSSSFQADSLALANIKWAEEVASYLRSVVSVVFLCHALYYSGYLAPTIDKQTQNTLSIGLAAISMAGNYLLRRFSFSTYWLQIALPCFAGFACGLVWVSIIADEIVSITQALGLVLGLSEEILGLTVVGFGNSLGDLVTNLTLTRMGYPMMAVSACFGGPMLYILLGIGVAACGVMAGSGPIGDTYWLPITSPTVLVSTACLIINSMLFLIAVPLQGFRITRTVGIAAFLVYTVGMGLNIYLEL